jgi:PIN domain
MDRLLFVDTNIWLDFYQVRTEAGLALLNHLDAIRDRLIMTYQVEMEFKKHRQEAILEGFKALKGPESVPRPGLFSDAKAAKAIQNDIRNAEKRVNKQKIDCAGH